MLNITSSLRCIAFFLTATALSPLASAEPLQGTGININLQEGDPLDDKVNKNHDKKKSKDEDEKHDGDPIELSTGAFTYSTHGMGFDGSFGELGLNFSYLSTADGYRSNISKFWTHNFEQELVLRVQRIDTSVAKYPGPVGLGTSDLVPQGNLTGGANGGGSSGGAQGVSPDTEPISMRRYSWSLFHYHGLRIDTYFNDTSGDVQGLGDSKAFVGHSTYSRILPLGPVELTSDWSPEHLTVNLPVTFGLRQQDGTLLTFSRRAWTGPKLDEMTFQDGWEAVAYSLTRIESPSGRAITLTYATKAGYVGHDQVAKNRRFAKVASVKNDMGGELNFSYANGRLDSVADMTGNTLRLHYDGNALPRLSEIERPEVYTNKDNYLGAPASAPLYKRSEVFTYESISSLIESISAPNEVTAADGGSQDPIPYVVNTWHERRVVRQVYGGVNASGIPAGGTYSFIYDFYEPGEGEEDEGSPVIFHSALDLKEASKVMVIDPSGNSKLSLFDINGQPRLTYYFDGQQAHPQTVPYGNGSITAVYDTDQYADGASLASATGYINSNVDENGSQAHRNMYVRRDYDGLGNLVREEREGVIYHYSVYKGHRLVTKRKSSDASPSLLESAKVLEPVFFGTWKSYDPRGDAQRHTPKNGSFSQAGGQWERYAKTRVYDYQEMDQASLDNSLDAFGKKLSDWGIQTSAILSEQEFILQTGAGITPPQFAVGLGDAYTPGAPLGGNADGLIGPVRGNVIASTRWLNTFVDAATPTPVYETNLLRSSRTYNAHGNIASQTDERGMTTEFYYYPKIGGVVDDPGTALMANGGAIAKTVVGVGEANADQSELLYNPATGYVKAARNAYGAETVTYTDEVGRVVATHTPDGARVLIGFDASGNVTSTTTTNGILGWPSSLPAGVVPPSTHDAKVEKVYDILDSIVEVRLHYVSEGQPTQSAIRRRYDKSRRQVLTLFGDWDASSRSGSVQASVLDEWGRIHSQTLGGVSAEFASLQANQDIPELAAGLLPIVPAGIVDKETFYGKVFKDKVFDGEGREWRSEYDENGRLYRRHKPLGDYTEYTYDVAGNIVRVTNVAKQGSNPATAKIVKDVKYISDESGNIIQSEHRILHASGDLQDPQDLSDGPLTPGDGYITRRFAYNDRGLLVKTVKDDGSSLTHTHDAFGRVCRTDDSAGNYSTTTYDALGNELATESVEVATGNPGAHPNVHRRVWNFYSKTGRLTSSVRSHDDDSAKGWATRYYYDAIGNVVLTTDERGVGLVAVSSLDLDGLSLHPGLAIQVNTHGNQTTAQWDGAGRSIATTHYMRDSGYGGGNLLSGGGGILTTQSVYDKNGRLWKQFDDNGNVTETVYDERGFVTGTNYADGTSRSATYDDSGRLHTETDQNGTVTSFTYDGNGRTYQVGRQLASGVEGINNELYLYDGLGRVTLGYVTTATDGNDGVVLLRRTYNSLSRIVTETVNGKQTTGQFDSLGRITQAVYPWDAWTTQNNGMRSEIEWLRNDPLGRVTEVREVGASSNLAEYDYLGVGSVLEKRFGNGLKESRLLDLSGVTKQVEVFKTQGQNLLNMEYEWGANDYRESRTHHTSPLAKARDFSYDSAGQMVSSVRRNQSNVVEEIVSYGLDGVGNRETVTGGPGAGLYSMGAGDLEVNAYTTTPGATNTYDANGNLVARVVQGGGSQAFVYDAYNRVVEISDSATGGTTRFIYGPFGRRIVRKYDDGSTVTHTTYRYLVTGALAHEIDKVGSSTGAVIRVQEYVYGLSALTPFHAVNKGQTVFGRYYLADDMNSVLAVADEQGGVVERFEYSDFGVVKDESTWSDKTSTAEDCNFLYAGKYYDWVVGLYDSKARTYDPRTGRFTSRDPLGMWADGANFGNGYTYSGNNPWTMVDPSGLKGYSVRNWQGARGYDPTSGGAYTRQGGLTLDETLDHLAEWNPPCILCGGHGARNRYIKSEVKDKEKRRDKRIKAKFRILLKAQAILAEIQIASGDADAATETLLEGFATLEAFNQFEGTGNIFEALLYEVGLSLLADATLDLAEATSEVAKLKEKVEHHRKEEAKHKRRAEIGFAVAEAAGIALVATGIGAVFASAVGAGAGAGVVVANTGSGAVRAAKLHRYLSKGEKIGNILNEAKAITYTTGNEVVLASLKNGGRALFVGGPSGVGSLQSHGIKRIIAHTHPFGRTGSMVPSSSDIRALQYFKQMSSWLFTNGQRVKFYSK